MNDPSARKRAYDPQQLEPMLIARQHAGDVDGMVALFEADAVIDCCDGHLLRGREAIRDYYAEIVASGRKFAVGEQRPALICSAWRSRLPVFRTGTSPARLPGGRPTAPGFG